MTSSVCYGLVLVAVLVFYMRRTGSRLRDVLVLRAEDLRVLRRGSVAPTAAAAP
jgi:hypothetical protein